jgi:hypothetical protein
MKRSIYLIGFVFMLSIGFSTEGVSQSYQNAIGLRFGGYNGVSYKQFLNGKNAFEIYGLMRWYRYSNLVNLTAVYQIHNPIPNVNNLRWYYGVGGTVGFYGYRDNFRGNRIGGANLGVLGTLGLDLALRDAPFNFSIDWSPTFYLTNDLGFYSDYAHIAVRYILGR